MEYHYAYAANESKEDQEQIMMDRPTYGLYVPLKRISNDLSIPGRRTVFIYGEDLELWKDFFNWLFEKYGKMLKKPDLKVHMLVGTIKKQRSNLQKEIESKSAQISFFPNDMKAEIDAMKEEIKRINVLEKICYENIDQFFEFIYG